MRRLLSVLAVLALVTPAAAETMREENDRLKARIAELEREIATLKGAATAPTTVAATTTKPAVTQLAVLFDEIPKEMQPQEGNTALAYKLREDWIQRNLRGRTVTFAGKVDYISPTGSAASGTVTVPKVKVGGVALDSEAVCLFKESELPALSRVKKGERLSVVGEFHGLQNGELRRVTIVNCRLVR